MSVTEAALRLEISKSLCFQLCAEGRLKHHRIGAEGNEAK